MDNLNQIIGCIVALLLLGAQAPCGALRKERDHLLDDDIKQKPSP